MLTRTGVLRSPPGWLPSELLHVLPLVLLLAASLAAPALAAELPPGLARASADVGVGGWGPAWRWRRVRVVGAAGEGGALAVAADPRRAGRVAVGHLEGVSVRDPGGAFRFAARVRGVTDLAFGPDGSLWIASLAGLWQLGDDERLRDRSPAPGDEARRVHRVWVDGDLVVAATEAGAWVARAAPGDPPWTRLADGLPRGPVTAAARDARSAALFLLVGRDLWRVGLAGSVGSSTGGAARVEVATAERIPVPGAPAGEAPRDLATGLAGSEVVLLYSRALAVRWPGDRFRILRPVLPPGAVATRVGAGAGRVWLATDRGLLHAGGWAGPWRRSEAPAGSAPVLAVAPTREGDGLLAASASGLLEGAPVLRAEARASADLTASLRVPVARDPDIRGVHAASLRYLGLEVARMRELREGLAVRGWIPSVSLRVAAARDKTWGRDYDQSFVSGETRHLRDRDEDKSLDLEASIVMTWDLGGLAFDGDAIDLSREHRQVVSLRDSVLDEVNQLYFERRALLEKLGEPAREGDPERTRMALRAAELAAGLDAWTGGWFSASASAAPARPDRRETHR